MDTPTLLTTLGSIGGTLVAGATALWKWIAKQLEECKSEHKESRARIEELHQEIKTISTYFDCANVTTDSTAVR